MRNKIYKTIHILFVAVILMTSTLHAINKNLVIESPEISAIKSESYSYKLSTAVINTVTFGDLNFNYEMPVFRDSSFVIGGHINPDKFQYSQTGQYGGVLGYKLYAADNTDQGLYFMSLIGYNREIRGSDFSNILSFEFWAGHTFNLQKNLYIDMGVGLGRKYDPDKKSEPAFLMGINAGFHFPDKLFWVL